MTGLRRLEPSIGEKFDILTGGECRSDDISAQFDGDVDIEMRESVLNRAMRDAQRRGEEGLRVIKCWFISLNPV